MAAAAFGKADLVKRMASLAPNTGVRGAGGESALELAPNASILEALAASAVAGFRTHVRSHYAWREIYRKQIDVLIRKGAE